MRRSLNHFLIATSVTVGSGMTTYWVATNEATAAIAEIHICFLVAIAMTALARH